MVSNKDINWIYDHIQDCYNQAKGLEKSILKDILGLFEAAPEFQIVLTANDVSDEEMRQLLEGMRHECVILPGCHEASMKLLEPAPEWIPVTERMPAEEKRVLVYRMDAFDMYTDIDTDLLRKGKWVRWGRDVTHWMPLPEPPKEA